MAPPPRAPNAALTGGYEYNRQIATAAAAMTPAAGGEGGDAGGALAAPRPAVRYRWVAPALLARHLEDIRGSSHVVLCDSLFFADRGLALPPRAPAAAVALLCHVLPWELWAGGAADGSFHWLAGAITTSGVARTAATDGLRRRHCAGPVRSVPPGVDLARFALADRRDAEEIELLTVANVHREKGHLHLLEVLAPLAQHRWRWRIVGDLGQDPATVTALRQRAAELGIDRRLELVGSAAGDELVACYQQADVAVFPTLRESYGMAIGEALACGLPVLASDVGGVREAVGGSPAARLLPAGDRAAWVAALRSVVSGDAERAGMAAGARSHRARLRSWPDAAGALLEAAAALVRGPARSR